MYENELSPEWLEAICWESMLYFIKTSVKAFHLKKILLTQGEGSFNNIKKLLTDSALNLRYDSTFYSFI